MITVDEKFIKNLTRYMNNSYYSNKNEQLFEDDWGKDHRGYDREFPETFGKEELEFEFQEILREIITFTLKEVCRDRYIEYNENEIKLFLNVNYDLDYDAIAFDKKTKSIILRLDDTKRYSGGKWFIKFIKCFIIFHEYFIKSLCIYLK